MGLIVAELVGVGGGPLGRHVEEDAHAALVFGGGHGAQVGRPRVQQAAVVDRRLALLQKAARRFEVSIREEAAVLLPILKSLMRGNSGVRPQQEARWPHWARHRLERHERGEEAAALIPQRVPAQEDAAQESRQVVSLVRALWRHKGSRRCGEQATIHREWARAGSKEADARVKRLRFRAGGGDKGSELKEFRVVASARLEQLADAPCHELTQSATDDWREP